MILEVKDLHKNYGKLQVLKGVSFQVKSGSPFAFLGRNGSGKSTTFRIIVNVLRANSGEILLDGEPFKYSKNEIGYSPEEKVLYQKKKVLDQLVYFAELKGMSHSLATKKVLEYLDRVELVNAKDKLVNTLSKGNQQKLQMIVALVHDPKVIILDEPFSGLDPVNAEVLKKFVREEKEKDKLILLSSHQMNYVEEFCKEMAILSDGKVSITGNISKIKQGYERNSLELVSEFKKEIANEYLKNISIQNDEKLILKFNNIDEARNAMEKITSEYKVDSIKLVEPSLNDIFVQYTNF